MSRGPECKVIKFEKYNMSNNPPRQKRQPTSKNDSTRKPDAAEFDPARIMELLERLSGELNARSKEMKSLTDFSEALDGAENSDLRIYWDVRIIRGRDTPFHRVQGVSTMPGILSPKMKGHAPTMIQGEVMDKIAQPLTAVFMTEAELQNQVTGHLPEQSSLRSNPITAYSEGEDSITRIASDMAETEDPDLEDESDDDDN